MTTSDPNPIYASVRRRARWVIAFFVVLIISGLLFAATDLWVISLVSRCQAGTVCTLEEAQVLDLSRLVLAMVDLAAYLATSIMFLVWLHAAYKYTSSFSSMLLQYTPGWAVGWWFVPILSLWKPYQVMRELWEASRPSPDSTNPTWPPQSAAVLGWWWAAYLAMGIVSNIDARVFNAANSASELTGASWISIASTGVTIVAALLAIYVVSTIDRYQAMGHDSNAASYQIPLRSAPAY